MRAYLSFILIIILASCSSPQATQTSADLFSGNWKLKSISGEDFSALKKPVSLIINTVENQISGYAGCNQYFSTYTTQGSTLKFSAIGSTKMFCSEGMALEEKYILALAGTESYKIENDKLTLLAGDKALLEFEK